MSFIQLNIEVDPEFAEIFIAELGELGYDTFEDAESGFSAYISEAQFEELKIIGLADHYKEMTEISYSFNTIEKQNWNEEWEKNYDPIEVDGKCRVRAIFHEPDANFEYEIVINPKMSFGTGHHATTWQILSLEMHEDFRGKNVLDIGTGTGVLAIMASKLGALSIELTDVDDWCIDNSLENCGLNDLNDIPAHLGTIDKISLQRDKYDVVLANINKNVLLTEMEYYSKLIVDGGLLFLSGFYIDDIDDVKNHAAKYNLSFTKSVNKDNWAAMILTKS